MSYTLDIAPPASDLDVALTAASAGAAALLDLYGGPLQRSAKSELDFATEADLAAERTIRAAILAARPDDGFVGEELGTTPGGSDREWLVDPLCGTLNYAAGTALYCVNVALRVGDRTTVAAVAHPPTGEVYWAAGERFGIIGGDRREATPVTVVDINADGPLDHAFVGAQLAADPAFRARFSPRVSSTTLALAWVATGQRLGYVTDGLHRDSVHFAAGLTVCRAAGCVVTALDGGPVHSAPGIVAAADAASHALLLELAGRYQR